MSAHFQLSWPPPLPRVLLLPDAKSKLRGEIIARSEEQEKGVRPVGKGGRTPCHGGPNAPRAARLQRSDGSSASEGGSSAARLSKSER